MLTLRKGTRLYHGTSAEEDFDVPNGPAWFSDASEVADRFSRGRPGPRQRVQVYRVARGGLRLPEVADLADLRRLVARAAGRRWRDPYEVEDFVEGMSVDEMADAVCGHYDGWWIPDNYGPGHGDILLCEPWKWLERVEGERSNSARRPLLARMMRDSEPLGSLRDSSVRFLLPDGSVVAGDPRETHTSYAYRWAKGAEYPMIAVLRAGAIRVLPHSSFLWIELGARPSGEQMSALRRAWTRGPRDASVDYVIVNPDIEYESREYPPTLDGFEAFMRDVESMLPDPVG